MAKHGPGIIPLTGYARVPKGRRVRHLQLCSIDEPSERAWADDSLTLFHGSGTALRQLSKVHNDAIRNRQDIYVIEVSLNAEKSIVDFLTFDDLKRTRFLSMERASKAVLECIHSYWRGYLREEGRSDEWISANVEWRHHRFMSDRPDLVPRLGMEHEFRHLALIAFQIVEGREIYKAATVLDPTAITEMKWTVNPDLQVTIAG